MRIGLVVEGICPGINNFIHTLTQRSEDTVMGFSKGWQGLYEDEALFMSAQTTVGFENLGGSILSSSSLKNASKSWKYKMMQNLLRYRIDLLLVAGNEYSLSLVNELFSAGIKVIVIPSADFGLNIDSYRIGLDTVLNELSECIHRFKDLFRTSGRKIVLCMSSKFRSIVEQVKNVHSFLSKEVSDQILVSWNDSFEDTDCLVKIDGILSASRPLKKDLLFAEDLAKAILSHSPLRGGTVIIYNGNFEFLSLQSFQRAVLNNVEGGRT